MNVLIVNTLYYPQGGAHVYCLNLAKALEASGHKPMPFAMNSPQNLPSEYSKYFVKNFDFRKKLSDKSAKNIWRVFARTFSYSEARENMRLFLRENDVDIIHLNNFLHYITLSIIDPIVEAGKPIVWTLHDSVLVCPNTNLFDEKRDHPCTLCSSALRRAILPPLVGCKKKSYSASAIAALESIYFSAKNVAKIPHFFVSPSAFLIEQHRRMGFDTSRFVKIPNFIDTTAFVPNYEPGNYLLFLGRLSREKGIALAVEAAARMNYPLVVAGEGFMHDELQSFVDKVKAPVKFTGFLSGNELKALIAGARAIIVPSSCYENNPLTVLEAFASGKAVFGSNIGGIPELVDDTVGGLFEPNNVESLVDVLQRNLFDDNKIRNMGINARTRVEQKYTPNSHLTQLLDVFSKAIDDSKMR